MNLGLGGGSALGSCRTRGPCLDVASLDLSNAFTFIETPSWWWPWYATPPINACLIWHLLTLDESSSLRPEDWAYPLYTRLAIGCSHGVLVLMLISLEAVWRSLVAGARLAAAPHAQHVLEEDGLISPRQWVSRNRARRRQQVLNGLTVNELARILEMAAAATFRVFDAWTGPEIV